MTSFKRVAEKSPNFRQAPHGGFAWGLKLTFSVTLIYFVFIRIDFARLSEDIYTINGVIIPVMVALVLVNLLLMTVKWRVFLGPENRKPFRKLLGVYWAGDFIGLFSFGAVGSEAYKALSLSSPKTALISSLSDRFFALSWYAEIGAVFYALHYLGVHPAMAIPPLGILFVLTTGAALAIHQPLSRHKFLRFLAHAKVNKQRLLLHGLVSSVTIASSALLFQLAFLAVGEHVELGVTLFATPVLFILLTLPISIQGFGVREMVFLHVGDLSMIDPVYSLLASFISYFASLLYRLLGLMPFLFTRKEAG